MRQHLFTHILLTCLLILPIAIGCGDDNRKKKFGDFCSEDTDCESGICYDNVCLDPDGDLDGDGLKNGVEVNLLGTDPGNADTDGDGVSDGEEVGDINAPSDRDGDGIIDALESRLPTADADGDCIPDEDDPQNDVYTNDMALLVELHCALPGVCETGRDHVIATCKDGVPQCDFSNVPNWEAVEASCDGLDNDCDGDTDRDLTFADAPECPTEGVCSAEGADRVAVCVDAKWACDFSGIPNYEAVETLCDGLDNNCDGETDEGLVGGECDIVNEFGTCPGTWACDLDSGEPVCEGAAAEAEICDGLDNNCDGQTDEGLVDEVCEATSIYGACPGTTVCDTTLEEAVCVAQIPEFDECDDLDNNCDGSTDENDICNKSARVFGRITGLPTPALPSGIKAAVTGAPIAGARITAVAGTQCDMTPPPEGVTDFAYSYADGSFILPLVPGYWCLFVEADGWESMPAWSLMLEEGDAYPLAFVLAPTDTSEPPLSVCGRTVLSRAMLNRSSDTNVFTPIPSVDVVLTQGEIVLGKTTSDAQGYFCIAGVQVQSPARQQVSMLPSKIVEGYYASGSAEGYYTTSTEVPMQGGILFITYLFLEPEPTEFTTCLIDDFENGGTDVMPTAVGEYWQPSEHINGVGWNQTWSWAGHNSFIDTCAQLPSNEDCVPGTADCAICDGQKPEPGCIVEPGHVPNTWSGYQGWYFGNMEFGAYLPFETQCEEAGPIVGGTLASPWFDTWRVVEMHLDLKSAWEVESYNLDADLLLVEMQTSLMSETDTWAPVGTLKPKDAVSTDKPMVPLSSGGIDRAPIWKSYTFDLTPFTGDMIRIRFRFDSIDGERNAFRGWLIDDVAVTGRGCQQNLVF